MYIEPKSFFIDAPITGANGTHKLAIYEWESKNPTKETVFCVHGLTRNGRDFDALASSLSENCRVFSIDVAGRGKSEWHIDIGLYNYPAYINDINHVINKLNLRDINWVGTSMGGIIGMMIANTFPGLLKTLTLNDIGCLVPAVGLKRISQYVGTATNFSSRNLAEAELLNRCAPYGIKEQEDWQHLFKHSIEGTGNGNVRLAYDPEISKGFSSDIQDINLWGFWEAVKTIPTLLIRGNDSDLLTYETAIQMKNTHPDLKLLEVENAGHAPALIDSEQVYAIKERIGLID